MDKKPRRDAVEEWWLRFWLGLWGTWAALMLITLVIVEIWPEHDWPVGLWACPLAMGHLLTYCVLRIRRMNQGRDDG